MRYVTTNISDLRTGVLVNEKNEKIISNVIENVIKLILNHILYLIIMIIKNFDINVLKQELNKNNLKYMLNFCKSMLR